jgi:hypothetical protein
MTSRTRMIAGLMSVATVLSVATVVRAQSDDMRAVIPFEFKAGKASLPAGTYTVTRGGVVGNALQLRSMRGGAILLSGPADNGVGGTETQLTFHRYGDSYFLRQIRFSKDREYTLPTTVAEREMIRASAETQGPSQVVVTIAAAR